MVKEIKFRDLSEGLQAIIIIVVSCIIGLSIGMIITEYDIINLERNTENIAHWECHNETTQEWVTLQGRVCVEHGDYWGGMSCTYEDAEMEFNDETDEVDCEEGIMINTYSFYTDEIVNLTPDPKKCLIKTTKEVCEIV